MELVGPERVEPLRRVGDVILAGPDFVKSASWLTPSEQRLLASISPVTGYGQKKNACLLFGVRQGYDLVLFWDDDELALHVQLDNDGQAAWRSTDILTAHAESEADVSLGFWTGFVSPIPDSFYRRVPESSRHMLTASLEAITDVVDPDTFLNRTETYCVPARVEHQVQEITLERGGKWVSGGNLAVRTRAVTAGRIPAFYTPTDSRGDDSIFSVGLVDARVVRVPAGIYHDAFGTLSRSGSKMAPSGPTAEHMSVARFAAVLHGWLAYAPLLTVLRDRSNSMSLLRASVGHLRACDQDLCGFFGSAWTWREPPSLILEKYCVRLPTELEKYEAAQQTWRRLHGA